MAHTSSMILSSLLFNLTLALFYIFHLISGWRGFHVCIKSPHVVLSLYENIFERPETHSGRESLIVTLKKPETAKRVHTLDNISQRGVAIISNELV